MPAAATSTPIATASPVRSFGCGSSRLAAGSDERETVDGGVEAGSAPWEAADAFGAAASADFDGAVMTAEGLLEGWVDVGRADVGWAEVGAGSG